MKKTVIELTEADAYQLELYLKYDLKNRVSDLHKKLLETAINALENRNEN